MITGKETSYNETAVKTYLVVGDLMRILVSHQASNEQYIVVETVTHPGGGMPLLHTHPAQETFYVIAGQHQFFMHDAQGNKVAHVGNPGDVVHIPNNAPHGYTNIDDVPGKLLMVYDAVGKMDEFFAEIGIPVADENNLPVLDGPPDMGDLMAVCARYGMTFLESPPPI